MFILPNLLLGVAQCLIALFLLCSWGQYLTIEVFTSRSFRPDRDTPRTLQSRTKPRVCSRLREEIVFLHPAVVKTLPQGERPRLSALSETSQNIVTLSVTYSLSPYRPVSRISRYRNGGYVTAANAAASCGGVKHVKHAI